MKTKQAAIEYARKSWKASGAVIVFQYVKGHWGVCTPGSPTGIDLSLFGMVSRNLNIGAKQWETVNLDR